MVESAIGQGRVVYVNVVDKRARTTLGVRGAGLGADLTLKGDLRTTIRLSTIGGLTRQGFSPTMETVPGARELRVEVRSLDYQVIRGFWQGTLRTTCSLKAICKQGTAREYEKVHNGLYQVGVQVVQSDDRNTRFVNIAVSNALNAMLGDTSLMECLAAPALTTSAAAAAAAAAGAASAPSVAVGKPKQESKRKSKRYATADGKAVAETLAALKALHGQGVLSDEEYMRKQRE
ncbi:MAG: YajG family lipoprotein, partial [Gammaproteobacteria bacterium]